MSATVVLYSTSVPTLPKVRADIATIKRILEAKKVDYEEVSSCGRVSRTHPGTQMHRLLRALDRQKECKKGAVGHVVGSQTYYTHPTVWFGSPCMLQIDLSANPSKREAMLAGSDNNTKLPQLHVNGQVGRQHLPCTPHSC